MKKHISIILVAASSLSFAQVIIGDNIGTAASKTSVLLEFANTGDKGIILPYVRTVPQNPTEGTIILDASAPAEARVKYFNGAWEDLSGQDADITSALNVQPTISESTESKAIIGAQTSEADGVLVLESATKAMVLPVVSSTDNVMNPSPGMMVYIDGAKKRLAVFNGSKWSFWKPTGAN